MWAVAARRRHRQGALVSMPVIELADSDLISDLISVFSMLISRLHPLPLPIVDNDAQL